MSETVKLIIEIPESDYKAIRAYNETSIIAHDTCRRIAHNGIPLDNDSDRAEVQAYFDGQAYGWEEGRKALIEDIKAEIKQMEYHMIDCDVLVSQDEVLEILDSIGKGDKE